jgi:hypothetical protein
LHNIYILNGSASIFASTENSGDKGKVRDIESAADFNLNTENNGKIIDIDGDIKTKDSIFGAHPILVHLWALIGSVI